MSDYQYAVYFVASNLLKEDLKKIRQYFQIRRRSGGGECGDVEKIRENFYRIAFEEEADQKRVLRKKDHTIQLSVQRNLQITLSCNEIQEDNSFAQTASRQQTASSCKPVEKILKLDSYLLRFLKENKKASLDLEKRLSSLNCSFKLDLDSKKVVVVKDEVKSDEDDIALDKWKAKVEDVFFELQKHYDIYFEFNPETLMILKQNPFLPTEDLGIYREEDVVVIVGEPMELQKLLKAMKLQQQICKECLVSEANFDLVKEQFRLEIESNFSEINIAQDRPGSVVLKGPKEQVEAAGSKLQELLSQIQEKRIHLHQALTTFLSSSGAIQKFQVRFQQSLRSPVLFETRNSDLVLMSLSTGALQEAAAAVQRDLCMESVPLEGTEANSPGIDSLKESLNQALQEANQGSTNVELIYQPGTHADPRIKVQVVGYSNEVSKLKKIIQDYKENQATCHDSLPLPLPEMVDYFSELLPLLGVNSDNVTLVATRSPAPCIRLSGPRCQVRDLKTTLTSAFGGLTSKRVKVDGPGVLQFFQGGGLKTQSLLQNSYQVVIVLLSNIPTRAPPISNTAWNSLPNLHTFVSNPQASLVDSSVALEIVFGGLEGQQVDVLVAPMLNSNLTSTKVGMCLLDKAGQRLKSNFDAAKSTNTIAAGDVLEVDGTPLGCKKVFFIECVPSSGSTKEKALRDGLERALALCEQQGWDSVAMPVIGPGPAMSVPIRDATRILTEVIGTFGRTGFTGSLRTIRIVMMPNYSDSEEMFQAVSTGLSGQIVDSSGHAVFQSLSSEIDEIIIGAGNCQLHLVYGDISNETTDAVVNTTDFSDFQTDVCSDILTVAGPAVQAQLTGAKVQKGKIFTTQPGNFPCKMIMHVSGKSDAGNIKGLARDIVSKCEQLRYQSVAIPAICAGKGGLDARLVAQSILQGVKDATIGANFKHLKIIRIVLLKIHVFLEFKSMAKQLFSTFTQVTAAVSAAPLRTASRGRYSSSLSLDMSSLVQSLPVHQRSTAEFLVIGQSAQNVSDACLELKQAYEKECSTQSFTTEELKHLAQDEIDHITNNADSLGVEINQQSPDRLTVRGLNSGVIEFNRLVQGALVRQVRGREQDLIFARVNWCILGIWGVWERLPKEANYQLENNNIFGGVLDAQGQKWTVNLKGMEATSVNTPGLVSKLKRLENLSDFTFPLYWDSMGSGEALKLVTLHPSSAEYNRVKMDFKRTVQKAVLKIERVQNVHLRRAYEVRKKELQDKNGDLVGAGEKVLYHGTTEEACLSIQRTNFDRRFAGQNATRFGIGTYFAVDASYSSDPVFSKPAADGTQVMFVALVLTGQYTQGQSDMMTPPPRSTQDPNDRYDSVVDNVQKPSKFVVFHDCQAYPDYLITFK
ncbi:protein mono-ADP-ribosyltransferase PARP14-like [Astyanax mexicanus]|uniref:protein mono-ADP-ribosyltransferase PARP14-like n=1 Tax=Astyanax mexicanus TaxID=7994 RepID=UPI0020CB1603|nr:protein mono-ADP-ribosyltransferase PARP14-like [Astyanax mexicanus]